MVDHGKKVNSNVLELLHEGAKTRRQILKIFEMDRNSKDFQDRPTRRAT